METDDLRIHRVTSAGKIIGTKENPDEYAYQSATVQLVGNAVPIVLDARPVRRGESRKEIVEELLDSAEDLVHVDNVLMDREFDSQHVLEMISQHGLSYVVPSGCRPAKKPRPSGCSSETKIAMKPTGSSISGRTNDTRQH